jgi:hypothetical protein
LLIARPWRGRDASSAGAAPEPNPAGTASQVVTIENGLTVAKDGTGQFANISAALEKVKPGQTIRVLDAGTYRETIVLSPTPHRGVTLESPRGASLELTAPVHTSGIMIDGVSGFVLSGFKIRAESPQLTLIQVKGRAGGVRLEGLDTGPGSHSDYEGVVLDGVVADADAPVVVQDCVFRRAVMAVTVRGSMPDNSAPVPCAYAVVRNNRVQLPVGIGLKVTGEVHHVQVVGNLVWGPARFAGIQLEHLMDGTEDVLVANNTVFDATPALRLWDGAVRGKNVVLRNNLFLGARGLDMIFLDSGFQQLSIKGPGDGAVLARSWDLRSNWREAKPPTATDLFSKSWVPPSAGDILREQIAVQSREPAEPNFLRPAKDSPLATGGAGGDLPAYVGAVPPEGVERWDWQKTWDKAHPKMVLTVSREAVGGGEFRTIGEALEKVKPGQTIRVLDGATYAENVVIGSLSRHAGITLEATAGATIEASAQAGSIAWVVDGVRGVTIRGFKFHTTSAGSTLIALRGNCAGARLEALETDGPSKAGYDAILCDGVTADDDAPAMIRDCVIRRAAVGISVRGCDREYGVAPPCANIVIRNNRLLNPGAIAMKLYGELRHVHILGNQIVGPTHYAAIQLEHVVDASEDIVIANNTVFETMPALRLWDHGVHGKGVRVQNNLVLAANKPDVLFLDNGGSPVSAKGPGDADALLKGWRWDHNWREGKPLSGGNIAANAWVPPAPGDTLKEQIAVLSRDSSDANFLRPAKDSPLASGGAGGDLPAYVGAVPPEGFEPWDWDKTWKAREKKSTK